MIVIYTDKDFGACSGMPFNDISFSRLPEELLRTACLAEDVYFWRGNKDGTSEVKALKRRHAALGVPDWLQHGLGVDG